MKEYQINDLAAMQGVFAKDKHETEFLQKTDWNQRTQNYVTSLHRAYDDVTVRTGEYSNNEIQHLVETAPRGNFLYISNDFIQQMGKSKTKFETGKQFLEKTIQELQMKYDHATVTKGALLTSSQKASWQVTLPTKQDMDEFQMNVWNQVFEKRQETKEKNEILQKQISEKRIDRFRYYSTKIYDQMREKNKVFSVKNTIHTIYEKLRSGASFRQKVTNKQKKNIINVQENGAFQNQNEQINDFKKVVKAREKEGLLRRTKSIQQVRQTAYLRAASMEKLVLENQRLQELHQRTQTGQTRMPIRTQGIKERAQITAPTSMTMPVSAGVAQVSTMSISF